MHLIKKTRSLDPLTLNAVEAEITEEDGKVYLAKDTSAGRVKSLIGSSGLYRKLQVKDSKDGDATHLLLEVTTRCNLPCKICYMRAATQGADMPLPEIVKRLAGYSGKFICPIGGEPTLREDLPDIIRAINKRNIAVLVTNGLKLADLEYVKALKACGLRYVVFSLHGLDDDILEKIDGARTLAAKTKALENIGSVGGMDCILSITLSKGLNTGELGKLFAFAAERDYIRGFRIRAETPVGRYSNSDKMRLSELLDLVSSSAAISADDVLKEIDLRNDVNRIFGLPDMNIPCALNFHVIFDGGRPRAAGSLIRSQSGGRPQALDVVSDMVRIHGLKALAGWFLLLKLGVRVLPFLRGGSLKSVTLISFRDKYDVDLDDLCKCRVRFIEAEGPLSCCLANIMRERKGNVADSKDGCKWL
jgi:molybdenum cofactor biosynthesis enzyme MoaA